MRAVLALSLTFAIAGCDFGSESAFTKDAVLDRCRNNIPVCNTTAGCKLVEEDAYTEVTFPGFRQIIVPTSGEAIIRLKVYWRTQLSPGVDTEILWYEPACVDAYRYESQGVDIFEEAGGDGVWLQEMRVFREGDHLVEVRSDATGDYVLRSYVLTPDEWDLEQRGLIEGAEDLPFPRPPT